MASHKIRVTLVTQGAGIPVANTGVMGMVSQGVAVAGKLVLDTCYTLTRKADMATLGIDAAYDSANGCALFQQLSEFYNQAGDGAQIWLQVCAKATAFTDYVQSIAYDTFIRQTAQADPARQAKIIGLCYAPPTAANTTSAGSFPDDVLNALTQAQIVQANHFILGFCYGVIVDGYNMKQGLTPATITTQATNSAYACSLCITGSKANGVSAVGAALAKYARISVGRGIGAVEDLALSITSSYLTDGVAFYAGGAALVVGNSYLVIGGPVTYNAATYQVGQTILCVIGHTAFTLPAGSAGYLSFGVTNVTPVGDPAAGGVPAMSQDDLDLLGDKQYFFITPVQGIQGLYWNDGATCTAETNFFCNMEYLRCACLLAYEARTFFTALRGLNLPSDVQTGALDTVFCRLKEKTFTTTYIDPLTNASGTGDITAATIAVSGPTYVADAQLNFEIEFIRSTILGDVVGKIGQTLTL